MLHLSGWAAGRQGNAALKRLGGWQARKCYAFAAGRLAGKEMLHLGGWAAGSQGMHTFNSLVGRQPRNSNI